MRRPAAPPLALLLGLAAGLLGLTGRPAPAPAPAEAVAGQVLGPDRPVAGATVRVQGTARHALSDERGHFRLPRLPGRRRVTAWREGFLITGARPSGGPLTLRLSPLPAEDNLDYAWVSPAPNPADEQACANCHAEIYREWSASGHARSASGRRFRNLYEGTSWDGEAGVGWGLVNDRPHGAAVCSSCHAPAIPAGDPGLFDLRELRDATALRGVHCDFCHKVADVGPGSFGPAFGAFNLRLLRPKEGQLFFGPLDDVDRGEDAFSPLYRDSRYCASCHEGNLFGTRTYTTYSEWLDSPARREGKHCQHCHMAPTGKMTNVAPGRGGVERPAHTLANHRFVRSSLKDMLRGALHLVVEPCGPGRFRVSVRADGVGHRVPTGFPDRHLVLVVEAWGEGGRACPPAACPTLPPAAGPELAGRPGRLFARLFHGPGGQAPVPFWAGVVREEDTRLLPGRANEATFSFRGPVLRLRVRLLYRRFWPEVVREKGWPDTDLLVAEAAWKAP
jgi:hypothetical protein